MKIFYFIFLLRTHQWFSGFIPGCVLRGSLLVETGLTYAVLGDKSKVSHVQSKFSACFTIALMLKLMKIFGMKYLPHNQNDGSHCMQKAYYSHQRRIFHSKKSMHIYFRFFWFGLFGLVLILVPHSVLPSACS